MGEVYRARDTRLDRTVAVKVLPPHLSENPQLRQRFQREAKALSSLSHPHICTLHDVGEENGLDFLVMEYLEGESLADRLEKGPLAPEQVLRTGIEIADALDKAHRQGVIHRDLKPGNIILTKAGAKLLDFGLAKPTSNLVASALTQATQSPSQKPLTAEGAIVGTLQYMAPEQLEGKEADPRADIFALGTVLYEMATGQKAFQGKSQASLIAAILSLEPPSITQLQPLTPPALGRLVRTCLAKDPEERLQTAHDVKLGLQWIAEAGSQPDAPVQLSGTRKTWERVAWATVALAALLVVGFVIFRSGARPTDARSIRFLFPPPPNAAFVTSVEEHNLAISPDGSLLAFLAAQEGQKQIWIRPLGSAEARPLPGTEEAGSPFWSPDGHYLAFFAGGKLKKLSIAGGPVQILCAVAGANATGTWSSTGTILFAEFLGRNGIYQVPASGGEPIEVINSETVGHGGFRWPLWLPDGDHFLYSAWDAKQDKPFVYVTSVSSKQTSPLLQIDSRVEYAPPYLLYVQERTLMAQQFDAKKFRLTGDPTPIAENLPYFLTGWAPFSVSAGGVLTYQAGDLSSQIAWFNRKGERLGSVGPPATYKSVKLAPDGQKIAVEIDSGGENSDLWILDVSRGLSTRFTSGPGNESAPVWSPDGRQIVYGVHGKVVAANLFMKPVGGGGGAVSLVPPAGSFQFPSDWSLDGHYLLYTQFDRETGFDIWFLPQTGQQKPVPLLRTKFQEGEAQFSPNGQWLASVSDESGRLEVYVRPFQRPGEPVRVSASGGSAPHWRRDGRELFYVAFDGQVYAVPVGADNALHIGTPEPLFKLTVNTGLLGIWGRFDVAPDGQRFLVITGGGSELLPITVAVNWTTELKK